MANPMAKMREMQALMGKKKKGAPAAPAALPPMAQGPAGEPDGDEQLPPMPVGKKRK